MLKTYTIIFLLAFGTRAHSSASCSATVNCGNGNQATCTSSEIEEDYTRVRGCGRSVEDPFKCRSSAFCEEVSTDIHACGSSVIKISDNSVLGVVNQEYVCCKKGKAIVTTNRSECN